MRVFGALRIAITAALLIGGTLPAAADPFIGPLVVFLAGVFTAATGIVLPFEGFALLTIATYAAIGASATDRLTPLSTLMKKRK